MTIDFFEMLLRMPESEKNEKTTNFIRNIVIDDLKNNKNDGKVVTRFPPEPNGYLHIGHAKSMCLNFGLAEEFNGQCNLRMDDTNPVKEEEEYVNAIKTDVEWMGYRWADKMYYASDYFEKLYEYAVDLVKNGKAYVDELSTEQIREYRGTLKEAGKESPWRDRPAEESLELLKKMRSGEFDEGSRVLRAKIDMSSGNINMRDPVIYRILKTSHHQTGDVWYIYPMYDFAHSLSDAEEGITHSLCTLEFEDHRPLYDWFINELETPSMPRQIEFARLNMTYTVLSKRKLKRLVDEKFVEGWDDPRMPTISGLRRRGYTPSAIKKFCDMIGVSKADNLVDIAMLEYAIREELNKTAHRRMAVLDPLKLVITNYEKGKSEMLSAVNNPEDESYGKREIPFSSELWIEASDFMVEAPKKFHRLAPGKEVRLLHAYYVTVTGYDTDPDTGKVSVVYCEYDPDTRGGWSNDGRKVKGTVHWVSAAHCVEASAFLYEHLFKNENPEADKDTELADQLNENSLKIIENIKIEPDLGNAQEGLRYQFLRNGYFVYDKEKSDEIGHSVFLRTVSLKDSWGKKQAQKK